MKQKNLESISTVELWTLHETIASVLAEKLIAKKSTLENRLRQLDRPFQAKQLRGKSGRRPYPHVFPKFRNPDQPSQTWAGRGKQPRWLTAQLKAGKRIDEFRIKHATVA